MNGLLAGCSLIGELTLRAAVLVGAGVCFALDFGLGIPSVI